MGRSNRSMRPCACGGWRLADHPKCRKCIAADEEMKHDAPTPSRSADIEAAMADECPERARFVEAVLARRRAYAANH